MFLTYDRINSGTWNPELFSVLWTLLSRSLLLFTQTCTRGPRAPTFMRPLTSGAGPAPAIRATWAYSCCHHHQRPVHTQSSGGHSLCVGARLCSGPTPGLSAAPNSTKKYRMAPILQPWTFRLRLLTQPAAANTPQAGGWARIQTRVLRSTVCN